MKNEDENFPLVSNEELYREFKYFFDLASSNNNQQQQSQDQFYNQQAEIQNNSLNSGLNYSQQHSTQNYNQQLSSNLGGVTTYSDSVYGNTPFSNFNQQQQQQQRQSSTNSNTSSMESFVPLRNSTRDLQSGSNGRSTIGSSNRRESNGGSGSVSGSWSGMNSNNGNSGGGSSGRLPAGPYARPADNSLGGPSANVKASSTTSEFTKRKNWSQHIIDEIQDFMHVLSPDGNIIFATPSIRDLTGWTVEEVTNRPISDFIHTDDIEGFIRDYETSLREGQDLTLYYRFRMKDDRYTIFEITGHPYYAEENGQRKCKCFFGMGRPYPSKNTAMLDSFLELKIENERLRQELQVMYQDIEGNGGLADYGPVGDYARERAQTFANSYELDSARFDSNHQQFGNNNQDQGGNNSNAYGSMNNNSFAPVAKPETVDKRKKAKGKTDDGEFVCRDCGTVDSPEWRKGPEGPKSLCNACGLRYAKLKSKGDKLKDKK